MKEITPEELELVKVIRSYQSASNRHDIAACVAHFTEDGEIVDRGIAYAGQGALTAAHQFDLGSETLVSFTEFTVSGDKVHCRFMHENALDRVLGTGGTHRMAEFTLVAGKIRQFLIHPPERHEMRFLGPHINRAMTWVQVHHPATFARLESGFNLEGGRAMSEIATLWAEHLRSAT